MLARQDNIARGSADWSSRHKTRPSNLARTARRLHFFEAKVGFQCSAHSSDGEFPLQLSDAGLLRLLPPGARSAQPFSRSLTDFADEQVSFFDAAILIFSPLVPVHSDYDSLSEGLG